MLNGCASYVVHKGTLYRLEASGEVKKQSKGGWSSIEDAAFASAVKREGRHHETLGSAENHVAYVYFQRLEAERARRAGAAIASEIIAQSEGPLVIGPNPDETRDANSDREGGVF